MEYKYRYNGIVFDDATLKEDDGCNDWTQMCDECAKRHGIPPEKLCIGDGYGICGVEGCENESDHYMDFKDGELERI